MPSPAELTSAAPAVPVLVLFGYSRVVLNLAGARLLGLSADAPQPPGTEYHFTKGGLVVQGNTAVYATIARLPALSGHAERVSSTERFLRELNSDRDKIAYGNAETHPADRRNLR